MNRMKNTKLYRTNNGLHYMPRVQVVFDKPTCLDHGLCVHGSVTFKASVCVTGDLVISGGEGAACSRGGGTKGSPHHARMDCGAVLCNPSAGHVSRTNEHK